MNWNKGFRRIWFIFSGICLTLAAVFGFLYWGENIDLYKVYFWRVVVLWLFISMNLLGAWWFVLGSRKEDFPDTSSPNSASVSSSPSNRGS
jgi:hypothetical protein